jgi:hypothetical protein
MMSQQIIKDGSARVHTHKQRTRVRLVIVVSGLMICAALGLAVRAYTRPPTTSALPGNDAKEPAVMESALPHTAHTPEDLEVENFILTRFGFEPEQITRSKEDFLLSVENRSGVGDVELHLHKLAGNRVHQKLVPKERPDWQELFSLPPGEYVLTEASHPDWQCHITITPH